MIPTPKLDDRTYADIVAEAVRLIPRYCPDWTNHNPSDPGITILELCSWMNLATNSLPTPLSPVMSTFASLRATHSASDKRSVIT